MIDRNSWEIKANKHLLGYINRRLSDNPRAYGAPNSAQQRAATEILVRYKHGWAIDMHEGKGVDRDSGEYIGYSLSEQRKAWEDCMRTAEDEINAIGARKAA
jgi:hypothetical protein